MFRRIRIFICFAFLLGIIHCSSDHPTQSNSPSYGFSIRTHYHCDINDTILHVYFDYDQIYDTLPKISVKDSFTVSEYTSTGAVFTLQHKFIPKFYYEIIFKGDTLSDTVFLPPRIDSLYCNGILLADSNFLHIDSSENYEFRWHKDQISKEYRIWYSGLFFRRRNIEETDTSILIQSRNNDTLYEDYMYNQGSVSITGLAFGTVNSTLLPNVQSGKLFAYYENIVGPPREVNFSIKSP